ncbi:uncharacterized protein LOC115964584 [Quercus lobata]|uniref:uncharacterized protein LOC115964584 n=1 Tax=Quercus lobata TaxID=97700 RepID=UPI0012462154|nr:uncharacterized protein LOC115964584 [Quercus lobata]
METLRKVLEDKEKEVKDAKDQLHQAKEAAIREYRDSDALLEELETSYADDFDDVVPTAQPIASESTEDLFADDVAVGDEESTPIENQAQPVDGDARQPVNVEENVENTSPHQFPATNNEAEYEAILSRLRIAKALGVENISLRSDSQLIVGQVKGDFEAKETRMQKYLKLTNQLVSNFDHAEIVQIPRSQNTEADEVAWTASTDDQSRVIDWRLEEQNHPSIEEFQTFAIHTGSGWTSPILSYLKDGQLPPNLEEAKKIKKRAARFTILND